MNEACSEWLDHWAGIHRGLPCSLVGYFTFFKNLIVWAFRLRDKSRKSISVWKMHCPRQGEGERERDGGNEACALFIKSVRGYRADLQLCFPLRCQRCTGRSSPAGRQRTHSVTQENIEIKSNNRGKQLLRASPAAPRGLCHYRNI